MCIICAKPAGIKLPDDSTIRRMFNHNRDGAGIMYTINGKVKIVKGLMTVDSVFAELDAIRKKIDVDKEAMVLHFRIGTAGGNIPANTHPYPITDSLHLLQKLETITDVGVAHNGIIDITPRQKNINDTMEYIMSQLAPLKRAVPKFYENKDLMLMVKNAISSKMAFLTADRFIYTIGDFIEDDGLLYSNSSYLGYDYRSYNYKYSKYYGGSGSAWHTGWDDDDWDVYPYGGTNLTSPASTSSANKPTASKAKNSIPVRIPMMFLNEEEYAILEDGSMIDSSSAILLIDENMDVYIYDFTLDCALYIGGDAYNAATGMPVKFNWERMSMEYVDLDAVYGEDEEAEAEDADAEDPSFKLAEVTNDKPL